MTNTRLAIAIVLVSLTALAARGSYGGTPGQWLGEARLPMVIGKWRGSQAPADDPKTVAWLGADGMVSRSYATGGGMPVALYVAYFERQRPGVTIHSPLHCLPGAGWDVTTASTIRYQPGRALAPVGSIRRLIVQKGTNRAVVLYWYALHGRMVASEIASRAYLLGDRIRFSRNDAALVRVVVFSDGDDRAAEQQGLAFIDDLRPQLPRLWS
ncbi:MAG: exosortase C-terminal domain/associated protein EpsI [Gammaproteobacteria bacterium]